MNRNVPLSILAACSALTIFGSISPAAAAAEKPHDGMWNVTIIINTGECQPSANYPLVVADGKISGPANVSGRVGQEGTVKVYVGGAFANGQLNGNLGRGRWNSATTGMPCSGRWVANKQ